jgi:2-iminobutanoate/2-iminopropanoate deaminase
VVERFPDKFSSGFSSVTTVDIGHSLLVFVSGHVGMPLEGPPRVVAGTFEEEARLCYANIAQSLAKVGGSLKDLVRITAFLTHADDYPVYASVREDLFQGAPPASASVMVAGLLANARLEVDGVAVVGKR